jgi:hypothetical protein
MVQVASKVSTIGLSALMPFWKLWTGINEISRWMMPSDDGKSCLDGMFGQMNRILQMPVDVGRSYWSSITILEAIESTSGMTVSSLTWTGGLRTPFGY